MHCFASAQDTSTVKLPIFSKYLKESEKNYLKESVICLKQRGNCVFPQNFHTWKLGEITVFYAVYY